MASVSVSEKDFENVATSALEAERIGNKELAMKLDVLARKISAALTVAKHKRERKLVRMVGPTPSKFTWKDVPTVLKSSKEYS